MELTSVDVSSDLREALDSWRDQVRATSLFYCETIGGQVVLIVRLVLLLEEGVRILRKQ